MKKKLFVLPLIALSLSSLLTACNGTKAEVGILQYGNFTALNNAREGFIKALADKGYDTTKIDYKNAEGKSTNVSTFADGMVGKYKLNLAIATPCATMMKTAATNIGNTNPLLFTAVTDPVSSGLVSNVTAPEGFVTGSSDLQPAEALTQQIQLAKKINPSITTLGILYCSSESNSRVQADSAKAIAEKEGLTVKVRTCTSANDIDTATLALVNDGCGAIWVPTDNTVAASIDKVKSGIGTNKVLLIAGEDGMLSGTHVTISIDYYTLGYKTGEMAAEILINGKSVKDVPVFYPTLSDCSYEYNSVNFAAAGFSKADLPTEYNWKDVANN